jgi:hypothetical protein
MILTSLQTLTPNDVVYLAGTGYRINRVVSDMAYVTREGTAGRNTYVIQKEGVYFTVSLLKGDRTMPWEHCGILHYLKKD